MSTHEWDQRVSDGQAEYIGRLLAQVVALEERVQALQARLHVASQNERIWFGTACKAVVEIDRLEQQNTALAGDLLLDRAFDGPSSVWAPGDAA